MGHDQACRLSQVARRDRPASPTINTSITMNINISTTIIISVNSIIIIILTFVVTFVVTVFSCCCSQHKCERRPR